MTTGLSGREVLAIDAGTQGISVLLWCPERRMALAVGEAAYEHPYIPGLPDGRLEQYAHYWSDALATAMQALRKSLKESGVALSSVSGIGVTGHMHCMVRVDKSGGKPWGCDMWNDPRGTKESEELSALLGEHIPGRWTASHILAGMRTEPKAWESVARVGVTSTSIVHDLTGEWVVGPGDASGMFGSLDADGQIDRDKLAALDQAGGRVAPPLDGLVPRVVPAGKIAGVLNERGSRLLGGLPIGTPVAAPEGDQQSVLVGAAASELELALSAGTSFTGNLPCRVRIKAESEAYNVLHAPDGLTMLMVCVRNGTVGFAHYVRGLAALSGARFSDAADRLTDLAAAVPADLHGITMLPFFQGENVVGLPNARARLEGAGLDLVADPGVMTRLLLETPCLTLRYGIEKLRPKIGAVKRVLLTGGALKSKGGFAPQLFADTLGLPVVARRGDEEGTAKGAAILAAYMVARTRNACSDSLPAFAREQVTADEVVWEPRPDRAAMADQRYADFERAVADLRRPITHAPAR